MTGAESLPWRKKLLFVAFASLVPVLLLLILGELGGRAYAHVRYGVPGKSYGIYIADEELGATHRPNSYNSNSVINNYGLRNVDDVLPQKPPGATRVYCSGGSTTFCYNLRTEEAWPSLLQSTLRRSPGHGKDEVLNAGQICFSVSHELKLARRLVPALKPDVAIVFTGINELMAAELLQQQGFSLDRLLAEKRWGTSPTNMDQARFLKRNSVLVRLWDYKVKTWFEKDMTAAYHAAADTGQPATTDALQVHPFIVENFRTTLRAYLELLRSAGVRVIVVRFGDNGSDDWHITHVTRPLREEAVRIGREMGAAICDVQAAVEHHPRRRDLFLSSGVHVTAEGAGLMADLLGKAVLETLERPDLP